MAPTFHPFPRLPAELRFQIWTLTANQRIVHLGWSPKICWVFNIKPKNFGYSSHTPVPAVLHVCRESRQIAPYKKTFSTPTLTQSGTETKYIWVNFQKDTICIADHQLEWLRPYQADIERLRIVVANADPPGGYWNLQPCFWDSSNDILRGFSALRELDIYVKKHFFVVGFLAHGIVHATCSRENIRFIDLCTGLLLTSPQMEMAYIWNRLEGVKVHNIDDIDEEIRSDLHRFAGSHLEEIRKRY
ncbi:hypothetical protein F5Y03DRAFT_383941 [Xylaria venustula]|nr:hypothetical protein F5Y03DRAFT_383941 [Xylaria venustula]